MDIANLFLGWVGVRVILSKIASGIPCGGSDPTPTSPLGVLLSMFCTFPFDLGGCNHLLCIVCRIPIVWPRHRRRRVWNFTAVYRRSQVPCCKFSTETVCWLRAFYSLSQLMTASCSVWMFFGLCYSLQLVSTLLECSCGTEHKGHRHLKRWKRIWHYINTISEEGRVGHKFDSVGIVFLSLYILCRLLSFTFPPNLFTHLMKKELIFTTL